MSMPSWLNDVQSLPGNENGAFNTAVDPSVAFLQTPTTASFDFNQLQNPQLQPRMQNGLDKGAWGDHLDRTRVGPQPRDRKHLNKGHTPASKVPSMVAHNSKELRHIRHPSNTRAVMLAFLHRCRTSRSIHKVYPSACPPCPRPRFRQRFKTSARGHRPRIRNMEVESIPLKTGLHHMCRVCHMAAAQTSPLIHRLPPTTRPLLRLNTAKARSPSNSSSSSSSSNNNACMRYDSGS